MLGQTLESVTTNPYLGVEFSNNLSWGPHIDKIVSKANKSLGLLRRNLSHFPENVLKRAYLSIVRPNLEFCSSVWDPHQENHKKKIEMVQRRAARYIKRNYSERVQGSTPPTELQRTIFDYFKLVIAGI